MYLITNDAPVQPVDQKIEETLEKVRVEIGNAGFAAQIGEFGITAEALAVARSLIDEAAALVEENAR